MKCNVHLGLYTLEEDSSVKHDDTEFQEPTNKAWKFEGEMMHKLLLVLCKSV